MGDDFDFGSGRMDESGSGVKVQRVSKDGFMLLTTERGRFGLALPCLLESGCGFA